MILILGLGNPGEKYKDTRHNVGFEVVDRIANTWKGSKKFKAEISETNIEGKKVLLAKPQTYMNLSGEAVRELMSFYKLNSEDIWVVSDDVDLELGKIRVRGKGSAGGHRGIQSIIDIIGTDQFPRFRVGVRADRSSDIPTDKYVLEKFSSDEEPVINESIKKTVKEIKKALREGIEHTSA